jgi:hypothetical protein
MNLVAILFQVYATDHCLLYHITELNAMILFPYINVRVVFFTGLRIIIPFEYEPK